jgi:1,4-dihydroxy-2-naphthoate octaprenyltransferase
MKKDENLSILSIEELNKKAKTAKLVTGLLAGMLIVQFAVGIYMTTLQGFNVFIVIPLAFLPILILNYTNIRKINEEIASRK